MTRLLLKRLRSQAAGLRRAIRAKSKPFKSRTGMSFEHLCIPTTNICLDTSIIRYTPDFLPDWYTLSGGLFEKSPHVDFANQYYADGSLDPRSTRYFRLTAKGRLGPANGPKEATARSEKFMRLLDQLRDKGYQPDQYDAVTMARCVDDSYFVLNGKHRLAGVIALGKSNADVSLCYCNEVRALYQDVAGVAEPVMYYRKSRKQLDNCGAPLASRAKDIEELQTDIKKWKLETWADIYHPIPFYEFRDFTTQVTWDTPYRRLGMIIEQFPSFENLRIIDLGCNIGFYSLSLARRGAQVTAFDVREQYIDIVKRLSDIYSVPVNAACADVDSSLILAQPPADITLCFSVLQWIADQQGFAEARSVLRAIGEVSKALLFDVAVNSGRSCFSCIPGNEKPWVERLIRESTSYDHIEHIGDVHTYGKDTRHVFFCRKS